MPARDRFDSIIWGIQNAGANCVHEVLPIDRAPIRAALAAVVAATRAEGVARYGCYEDTQQSGRFGFVERWRDKAALDRHLATPHMADWMKAAGPKLKSALTAAIIPSDGK